MEWICILALMSTATSACMPSTRTRSCQRTILMLEQPSTWSQAQLAYVLFLSLSLSRRGVGPQSSSLCQRHLTKPIINLSLSLTHTHFRVLSRAHVCLCLLTRVSTHPPPLQCIEGLQPWDSAVPPSWTAFRYNEGFGYNVLDVTQQTLQWSFYGSKDGTLLDKFTITKKPWWRHDDDQWPLGWWWWSDYIYMVARFLSVCKYSLIRGHIAHLFKILVFVRVFEDLCCCCCYCTIL